MSEPKLPKDNHQVKLPKVDSKYPYGFVDADWASNPLYRHSLLGLSVFLAGAPIIYCCKFQHCVALSTTESELYAASDTGKYIKYIRSVLKNLGYLIPDSTPLFDENSRIIAISNNEKPTKRVRHVDIRYFSILE